MHKKVAIYVVVMISLILINTLYYQQQIIEMWMRYQLRKEYIVISLTTTPHRIKEIQPVIDFALQEKIPIKQIFLNIPHIFKRDNITYEIPISLQTNKAITILRTKDYGPATKLLGALEKAAIPDDAIIITLDDDIKYPKDMLLYLAYRAMQNPDYATGLSGMNPHYNKHKVIITDSLNGIGLKSNRKNYAFVSILEGFAGVAYRKHFFDPSIFEIENAPRECINSDDLYISFHLAKKGIPRQVLHTKEMNLDYITWNTAVGFNKDALHNLQPRPAERHRACVAFMRQHNPGVEF